MEVSINPHGLDTEYLDSLRICFPGRWDEASYRWYHKRPFLGRQPEICAVLEQGRPVAGLTANYRQLELGSGDIVDVAIFTATWSLPEHRGKWHFSRLLRVASGVVAEAGCLAGLSFVTGSNVSAALLSRAGASSVPSHYVLAPQSSVIRPVGALPPIRKADAAEPVPVRSDRRARFHYARPEDWQGQFVRRPNPTTSLDIGDTLAVIEHVGSSDRLQYLSNFEEYPSVVAALAQRSHANGRDFFHFTMSASDAASAAAVGMRVMDGYVKVTDLRGELSGQSVVDAALLQPGLQIQCGDRM